LLTSAGVVYPISWRSTRAATSARDIVASGENAVSLVPLIIPFDARSLMALCISALLFLMSAKSFGLSLTAYVPLSLMRASMEFVAGLYLPPTAAPLPSTTAAYASLALASGKLTVTMLLLLVLLKSTPTLFVPWFWSVISVVATWPLFIYRLAKPASTLTASAPASE